MSQYSIIESGGSLGLFDESDSFRWAVVAGTLYLRQTMTATGFSGVKGVDWDNIESYPGLRVGPWRLGVRDLHWGLERTITALGFGGYVNVDFETVESHKLP